MGQRTVKTAVSQSVSVHVRCWTDLHGGRLATNVLNKQKRKESETINIVESACGAKECVKTPRPEQHTSRADDVGAPPRPSID